MLSLVDQDGVHSAAFHPEGNIVVVGSVSARWIVIDTSTREIISTHTDGNEQLECMEFSPGKKYWKIITFIRLFLLILNYFIF